MKSSEEFNGKEVSCKAVLHIAKLLEAKGYPKEVFSEWSGYPLKHLFNKHERIDWSSWLRVAEHLDGIFTDEEYYKMGFEQYKSPVFRTTYLIGGLLFSPKDFFKWMCDPDKGEGNMWWANIRPTLKEIGPNHLQIDLTMHDGYEPWQNWFLTTKGSFANFSEAFGYGPSTVEMEWIDGGARYDVHLPEGKPLLGWVRRAVTRPFTKRAAGHELKEALEQLHQRYADLEKEMKRRKETEEQFSTLVENASDVIFTTTEGKLTTLNKAFEGFTGFKRENWIGESYLHLICPDDQEFVSEITGKLFSGEDIPNFEIRILTSDGHYKWGEFSANPLIKAGEIIGAIGIVRDITERKRAEQEVKRQLMKFDLEDGNLYMVKETSPTMTIEAFKDLLKIGNKGYVVSRTPEDEFRRDLEEDYDYFWLAETGKGATSIDDLETNLQTLPRRSAILIDRLDYIIFKEGFDKALTLIHKLRELAYLYSYVVIIAIDPKTIDEKELALLEKETNRVGLLHKDALRPDLMDVVGFVYKQNARGLKPSYNDIGRALGLSKPTIYKRMKILNASGYLKEVMKGRQKAVEVSDKGTGLFKK